MPGPTVYSGGTTKSAGATCSGVETVTTTGASYSPSGTGVAATSGSGTTVVTGASGTTLSTKTTSTAAASTSSGSTTGCTVAKYGQCGGSPWTGCTTCAVCISHFCGEGNVGNNADTLSVVWIHLLRCLPSLLLPMRLGSTLAMILRENGRCGACWSTKKKRTCT